MSVHNPFAPKPFIKEAKKRAFLQRFLAENTGDILSRDTGDYIRYEYYHFFIRDSFNDWIDELNEKFPGLLFIFDNPNEFVRFILEGFPPEITYCFALDLPGVNEQINLAVDGLTADLFKISIQVYIPIEDSPVSALIPQTDDIKVRCQFRYQG